MNLFSPIVHNISCISPGAAMTAKYQRFVEMWIEGFAKCKPHPECVRMNVKQKSVILGLRYLL